MLLLSGDRHSFEVSDEVVAISGTLKALAEDIEDADEPIPVPNIPGKTLALVLEWCSKPEEFSFGALEQSELIDVIMAANYLAIEKLLDEGCGHLASLMKGKNPEELRDYFNIANDFTPEEEEAVRRENAWAFTH